MALSFSSSRGLQIGTAVVGCVIIVSVILVLSTLHQMHAADVERSVAELEHQLAEIKFGSRDSIHLYEATGTDDLLATISDNSEVHRLYLELTDVSDAGIEYIAQMPELQSLTVYGGRPGLSNTGLAALSNNTSIAELQLINTRVSDNGLNRLQQFKALRSLVLYYNAVNDPPVSDSAFVSLQKLGNLEQFQFGGSWASAKAVEQLRSSLPNCTIETYSGP